MDSVRFCRLVNNGACGKWAVIERARGVLIPEIKRRRFILQPYSQSFYLIRYATTKIAGVAPSMVLIRAPSCSRMRSESFFAA